MNTELITRGGSGCKLCCYNLQCRDKHETISKSVMTAFVNIYLGVTKCGHINREV